MLNKLITLKGQNWKLPLFFFVVAAFWLGTDSFPAEGWALGGADMRGLFYPWWEFVRNSLFKSQLPFWDPRHFAGSPFLHNPQIAFFYPPSWLVFLMPINVGISVYYLFHLSMAGWGMARLVELLGKYDNNRQPIIFGATLGAVAAGLAFMLGGFFASRVFAGHIGFLATHCWLPWILAATAQGLATQKWHHMAPAAIFFALAILAGHTTTLLYLGLIWGLFTLWQTWSDRYLTLKFSLSFLTVSLFFSLWLAAVQLVPTWQLIQRSGRLSQGGYDFATRFSLPWGQLISLFVPEWFGEPTRIGYWGGENFEELTAYPGIFATATFVMLLIGLWHKRKQKSMLFFSLLAVFGILIAVGSYGFLFRWLYLIFPPFQIMRAPGRALFFVTFSAPALLGLLIGDLFDRPVLGRQLLNRSMVVLAVIWLGLLTFLFNGWMMAETPEVIGRRWHQLANVVQTGIILLLGLFLIRWLVSNTQQRSELVRLGSLGFLLLLGGDLAFFGQKLIRVESMTPAPLWVEAAQNPHIGEGRILPWGVNIFEQNGAGQVGLHSIFGYNTLENGAITRLAASVPDPRSKAYDVLGVTHVVAESGLEQFTDGDRGLDLVSTIEKTRVYSRPTALGHARLVGQYELYSDAGQQISRLHEPDFDPEDVVLLETEPGCVLSPNESDQTGVVDIVERWGGHLAVDVTTDAPTLLVIAETYFPGWQVTINGENRPLERAYTAVQAVCVPVGQHRVEFDFRPTVFVWSGLFSLLGLCVLPVFLWKGKQVG